MSQQIFPILSTGAEEDLGGDIQWENEDIPEEDRRTFVTDTFIDTGEKLSITIDEGRSFIITKIFLVPHGQLTLPNNRFVSIVVSYGEHHIDDLYYNLGDKFKRDESPLTGQGLHGDGSRKLVLDATELSGGSFHISLRGVYRDTADHKPLAVSDFTATSLDVNTIRLQWNQPLDNGGKAITHYIIERSLDGLTGWTIIANPFIPPGLPELNITFDDDDNGNDLDDNTEYFYRVTAVNSIGSSTLSEVISATTFVDRPDEPTNLIITQINSTQLKLDWEAPLQNGGVQLLDYKIERGTIDGETFETIVESTGTTNTEYMDTGLDTNTEYFYRVSATNIEPDSSLQRTGNPSNVASFTPTWDKPTNLTAILKDSNFVVQLDWNPPDDTGGFIIDNYQIERSVDNIVWEIITQDTAGKITFDDASIHSDTFYYYRVSVIANNLVGLVPSAITTIQAPKRNPTRPENLNIVFTSDNLITLDWDAPLDSGGEIISGYKIERSTPDDTTFVVLVADTGNSDTTFDDTGLTSETPYFYRVTALTPSFTNGKVSPTVNDITKQAFFGDGSDGNLTVTVGMSPFVVNSNMQYQDVIIETGAVLEIDNAIIKINGDYTEQGTGQIILTKNGCVGGVAGITIPGGGGFGGPGPAVGKGISFKPAGPGRPGGPGLPASLISPGARNSCGIADLEQLLENILDPTLFVAEFTNQLKGGYGSAGTIAKPSGAGGNGGTGGGNALRSGRVIICTGGGGGKGGEGAQGAEGVRGGGKLALYIREIIATLRVDAAGNDGIDGIDGTSDPGDPGGIAPSKNGCTSGQNGSTGATASALGSDGSNGSQGGMVYVLYETATLANITITLDGGAAGLGGASGGSPGVTGEDGEEFIISLADAQA